MRTLRKKKLQKRRRNWRSRRKIHGDADRPRLTVFRSGRHIYVQIINDFDGHTMAAASTLSPPIREEVAKMSWNSKGAEKVGELAAKRALEKGIKKVCFDRNGYRYHGRVKALAESLRKNGLEF